MPRNYWKWTAPLLCVSCLGWGYSQDDQKKEPENAPTYSSDRKGDDESGFVNPTSKNRRNPLNSDSAVFEPNQIGRGIHVDEHGDVTALFGTTEPRDHLRVRVIQRSEPYMVKVALTDQEVAQLREYQNAIAKLRSDESNAEGKQEARELLAVILQQMMAADLEKRKQEVNTLELRVVKMRSQFDNRRAKQDQIIDLRLKTIQNEIDGLGLNQLLPPDGIDVNTQFTPTGAGAVPVREYFDSMVPHPETGSPAANMAGQKEGTSDVFIREDRPGVYNLIASAPGGMGMSEGVLPSDQPIRMERRYHTVSQRMLVGLTPEEIAENKQYASSLKVLRSDESEAAKQSARDALRQLLVKRFTRDILTRENDLVELEKRVMKLREQLDKRIAAKDQIVELQLTTIQNEIDGLGFDEFQSEASHVQVDVSDIIPVRQPEPKKRPEGRADQDEEIPVF
jgi:hypothetical protein